MLQDWNQETFIHLAPGSLFIVTKDGCRKNETVMYQYNIKSVLLDTSNLTKCSLFRKIADYILEYNS